MKRKKTMSVVANWFRGKHRLFTAIALIVFSAVWMPAGASADPIQVLKSFDVGEVSGIAVDANGIVWFTQRAGLKLGRLDPGTGAVQLYPIPYQTGARYGGGGNPEKIIVSSTGDVWFTEIPMTDGGGPARVARFHPGSQEFDEYLINPSWWNGYGGSISILAFGLAEGPDGRIWFNDRSGYAHIGNINPVTGAVAIYDTVPSYIGAWGSTDIAVTPNGTVWYSNGWYYPNYRDATYENGLYRFDEASGVYTNLWVTGAHGLAADSSGDIWFTTWATPGAAGKIGQAKPDGSVLWHTYANASQTSGAYIDTDSRGNVWFSDWSSPQLWRFDSPANAFRSYPLPFFINLVHVDPHDQLWVSSWSAIAQVSFNHPPVAEAGPALTVECAGPSGAAVTLDGSGSSDPDSDTITYAWTGPFGAATGVRPTITLPLGVSVTTLTVDDGKGGTATDTVTITVRDATPPVTTVRSIAGTSGDNGWYKSDVLITVDSADGCSGVKEIRYSVDGAAATAPGNTATIAVKGDGIHGVTFGAVDNAGNIEQSKTPAINIDKTAPITQAALSGTYGSTCYNSDVIAALSATDALSGVSAVQYRLNGGPWRNYAGIFTLAGEGAYLLGYQSTDKAGNSETEKLVSFTIDKTAPEAILRFDAATKDIKVYNSETGAEASYVVLPAKHDNEAGDNDDNEHPKELRQYTLQDCANNTLLLTLAHKNAGHEAKVRVVSMQYADSPVLEPVKNKLQAEFAVEKDGAIKQLEQKITVKKQIEVEAQYSSRKDETRIEAEVQGKNEIKETRTGMTILELLTDKGGLAYR